jgi:hypothetical protein
MDDALKIARRSRATRIGKGRVKKNPSDLKSRAKSAAKAAADSAREKAKSAARRAGAATSRAAKAGAKKGAEVAKRAAKAGAAKGAEMTKKAAVYTGEKLKQGGKRVGRKAAGVAKEAWSGIVKGWKENPTGKSDWNGLKSQIDWLMGRVHVGTPDEEVRANIEKRCKKAGFDAKLTRRCSDYAIKAHRKNQQMYSDVMSGSFGPKRRKTKSNPTLYKRIAANPVPRAGGYIYRISYETWDEEALEAGETDDKGWKVEESESYDTLESLLDSVSHDASWLEWSSSHPSSGDWIISQDDQDYRTGDRTQYSLFIERSDGKPLTTAQLKLIDKKLRLRGTFSRAKPRSNPSQDQVHLAKKGKQWHVMLDKHWVPISDAEAKRQIESGEAVKVPWSHKEMAHHDRPDYIDPKRLGLMLQNWHYGQGDPVYAVGSSLFAGKTVSTEVLADALDRIRSLKTSSTARHDKKGHKELVTIEKSLEYLVGTRRAMTAGRKSNPVKKSVKFLAWTNAPAAYDYWYVKDTGKSVNGFRLVEVTDRERWEQFQVPRYESGMNIAFPASDKARVEQFGLGTKAKTNPVKKYHVYAEDGYESAHSSLEAAKKAAVRGSKLRGIVYKVVQTTGGYTGGGHGITVFTTSKAKTNPVRSGGKVKARSITLTKLSGSKSVGKSVTLEGGNVWAKADRQLSLWAEPPAQEKVKFTVSYADAETYTGSYATKSSGRESLAGHIRMTLDAVAAASPSQISEKDREKWAGFRNRYETGCKVCDNPTIVTKSQVKKLLAQYKIPGQLSGKGSDWTLELPDEKAYKLWNRTAGKTVKVGGYRSGFGSWVLSPGYQSKGDWNDISSRWHY